MGSLQRRLPQITPIALLCAAFPAALAAALAALPAARVPRIDASVSKTTITVGDTISYRVRVVADEGATVLMPGPSQRLGDFEVLGRRRRGARPLGDGSALWTDEYLLAAYAPGERAVAAPPVLVVGSAGDTVGLACDTTRVLVESVLGTGDQELRDIKGPATIAKRRIAPALAVAAAAAVAALCAALVLRRRRRRALDSVPAAPRPPEVTALERLDGLLAAGLPEKGRLKEYYVVLSEVLRGYLEDRYLVPALEMTTAELAGRLEYLGLPAGIVDEACEILLESDMVKFAKYKPELETAFEAAKRARELILRGAAGPASPETGVS
jgi:hypothetical protein